MALTEGQVQVRGLVMGRNTAYKLLEFDPWSRQVRADQGAARAWNDGAWSGAEWQDKAVVPMRIRVLGSDAASWLALHQALAAAFAPSHEDLELRWVTGGVEFLLRGRPRLVEPEVRTIGRGQVVTKAAWAALDPAIYSGTEHTTTLTLPSASGGLTVPLSTTLTASATFGVPAASAWSPADTGQVWTTSGGVAADYNVAAGVGTHRMTATNSSRWTIMAALALRDVRVQGTVSTDVLAAGGGHFPALAARFVDTNNCYLARAEMSTAATVVLTIRKRVAGVETQLASFATGLVHAPGTRIAVVLETVGGVLRAKAWLAANPEPAVWHLITEDPDLTAAGAVACRSILSSTNSNVLPVTASWDDISVTDLSGGGLTVPVTVPATVTAGRVTIAGLGTRPVGMQVRIDGPVQEPRVSMLAAGVTTTLRLWLTLDVGQWLDIDTAAKTVYLNGTASRRGQASGGWPTLPPNGVAAELAFDASVYDPTTQLTATWRDAWY